MVLEGQSGLMFRRAPEEEAFQRWQRGEFLDLERQTAKAWREGLSRLDLAEVRRVFQILRKSKADWAS